MEKMDREKQQDQTPTVTQTAVPGSDEWWAARLAAVAGGRASSQESNDWVGDFGGTTSDDTTDDVCGDLTDDLASG